MKNTELTCTVLLCVSLAFGACKSDKKNGASDGGVDSGSSKDAGAGKDAGGKTKDGGSSKDAGAGKDAGGKTRDAAVAGDGGSDNDAGPGQSFHVPSAGGNFTFKSLSGVMVTFKFPASATAKDITVTPVDPASVSWAATGSGKKALKTAFSDVIELGPAGTKFTDPVTVSFSDKSLIAFNWSDPTKAPDPLQLSSDGLSLMLTHFSSLGIVAPNEMCESASPWTDTPNQGTQQQQPCFGQGTATSQRSFGCKNYRFCYTIQASCCVVPGAPGPDCHTGDKAVSVIFQRANNDAIAYPYCAESGGTTPYVSGYAPSMFTHNTTATDQMITLNGSAFDPNGSVFVTLDSPIATTWVNATQVTAMVPGNLLTSAGSLTGVGFVNPKTTATAACAPGAVSNCDWTNRSNVVMSITIQ